MESLCYGCMRPKQQSPRCEHCGFPDTNRNELHQLPMGTVLQGHYVIGRVLGQGGFGITYLGWDRNLDAPVAIKEYFPTGQVSRSGSTHMVQCTSGDSLFQEGRDRFLREARTLAKLRSNHNIVQVMSFFSENNTAYIVMEYIQGITLQEYIRRRGGRLTVSETFTILHPIIAALSKVHQAGMIHRDISPDNIMLQTDGTVKLLDFGTARDVDVAAGGQMTHSTQAVLKHGFAPMEQYSSGRAVDLRADEYALCSTVYYCLTCRIPPDAPQQVMDGTRPDWRSIPGLSPAQVYALERGTALRAEDRFFTLDELERALFGPAPTAPTHFPQNTPMPTAAGSTAPFTGVNPIPPQPRVPQKPAIKKGLDTKWAVPIVAALVAVAVLLFSLVMLTGRGDPEPSVSIRDTTAPQEAAATAAAPVPVSPKPSSDASAEWRENVLMDDTTRTYPGPTTVLGSKYERISILTTTFLDSLADAPRDAWDVSAAQDGSVMAWVEPAGDMYHLYIAGNGGVRAPSSCEYLFSNYEKMTTLNFNGNFHVTSDVTNTHYMFGYCRVLESLDVSGFDTSNVTNMNGMFVFCDLVTTLDVSSFDTSNVTNMGSMFYCCYNLSKLDLRNFDTSNVTSMYGMFNSCQKMTSVDVSSFDTSKVKDMSLMFGSCNRLSKLDIRHFDTSNVEDMFQMFACCYDLKTLDLSNFDTSNVTDMAWMFAFSDEIDIDLGNWETGKVEKYERFMEDGVLYNGKPWEKLF